MGTRLLYGPDLANNNFIELGYIRTNSVSFENRFGEDGVDYLFTDVAISVEAIFSGDVTVNAEGVQQNQPIPPAQTFSDQQGRYVGSETPAQTMARVRATLMKPQQQLQFIVGDDLLIQAPDPTAANPNVDCDNGPHPIRCVVKRITGTSVFLVSYEIRCAIFECAAGDGPPDYASHRWTEQVTIDRNFYSKRTRTGKIWLRANMNTNPDSLRGLVSPAIEKGFRREESTYVLQSDGLALGYTFIDQEVYRQAPAPATEAQGRFTISTANGAVAFAECRVKLTGPRHQEATKSALITQAMAICQAKISAAGAIDTGNGVKWVSAGLVSEDLYQNEVEVFLKAMLAPEKDRKLGLPLNVDVFDLEPAGSETGTEAMDPGLRGTANLALIAAALKDPCLQQAANSQQALEVGNTADSPSPESQITGDSVDSGGDVVAAQVYTGDLQPDDTGAEYATDVDGFFTDYQVNSYYQSAQQVWQLPVASDDGSGPGFVQTAAATITLVCDFTAEKIGDRPEVPTLDDDSNAVLLDQTLQPCQVELAPDGESLLYRLKGRLAYGFVDPTTVDITYPTPPWMSDRDPEEVTFNPEVDTDPDVI